MDEFFKLGKDLGISDLQVNQTKIKLTSLIMLNKNLDHYEIDDTTTTIIKGHYKSKLVQVTTDNFSSINFLTILNDLINSAQIVDNEEEELFLQTPLNISKEIKYDHVDFAFLKDLISKRCENDMISQVYITEKEFLKVITNSYGRTLVSNAHTVSATVEEIISQNNNSSCGLAEYFGVSKDFNLQQLFDDARYEAISKLHVKILPSKKYSIVLTANIMSVLLDSFISSLNYEEIRNNKSFIKNKEHEKIMSSKITIIEDPTNHMLCGYRPFDDDMNETFYKEVIKDGVLNTYLLNEKNANLLKRGSTGNGYDDKCCRNLFIKPGLENEDELIKNIKDGVLITSLMGTNTGINLSNGDISLPAEGYLIENGKKSDALKQFVLVTSYNELFNNVLEVGNDLTFINDFVGSPSVSFKEINLTFKNI